MLARGLTLAVSGLLLVADFARAADDSAAVAVSRAMTERIDQLLRERWTAEGIEPAPPASDSEFLRRVYLDLTGRIPEVSEVQAFLNDPGEDPRGRLIETLLGFDGGFPHHASHLANIWNQFLLLDATDTRLLAGASLLQAWLRQAFADNQPYDELVKELLTAEGQVNSSGPVLFYTANQVKPESLAASTSRAFLGVQIQCAQCHDHPFDHWTQQDFWGFAAFFARLSPPGGGQRYVSVVQDQPQGELKIPGTEAVVQPTYLRGAAADDSTASRRELLANWMTSGDNPYFARAAVNRCWSILFGRGLVEPVDDLGNHNPSLHPELLDELSAYFVASGFDIRNLLRTLAKTRAYQLTSAGGGTGLAQRPEMFERMAVKTLTAEQLLDCLDIAMHRRVSPSGAGRAASNRSFDQNRQAFLTRFRSPGGGSHEYDAGIPQALTLMNGVLVGEATDLARSDVLVSLQAPVFSDRQRVEILFMKTLARLPTAAEQDACLAHVEQGVGAEDKERALSDILWALLNTAEFTLNH